MLCWTMYFSSWDHFIKQIAIVPMKGTTNNNLYYNTKFDPKNGIWLWSVSTTLISIKRVCVSISSYVVQ